MHAILEERCSVLTWPEAEGFGGIDDECGPLSHLLSVCIEQEQTRHGLSPWFVLL